MSFEGHPILPSEKIPATEESSLKRFSQLDQIVSPEDSVTPESEIENESDSEDFEIYTKTGLSTFFTFLKSEQEAKDSLDADLDIAALDLPKGVETSLRQVRIEYADLIRLVTEVLDTADEEVSEEAVFKVHEQYTSYIEAQDTLAELYSAYLNSETAPAEAKETSEAEADPEQTKETQPQSVSETKIESVESSESSENIQKLRTEIEKEWTAVRHLHDSLHGSFPKEKRGQAEEAVLSQLADYFQQAGNLRQKAFEVDEVYSTNPEADLQRYQSAVNKIKEQAVSFVEAQSQLHEEKNVHVQEEAVSEEKVPQMHVSPETPVADVKEQTVVEKNSEPEMAVDYSAAQAKVAELESVLKNHPALTPQEHQTIQWSIDNLNEKVKSQAAESAVTQAIEIADSLTVSEVQEPGFDALKEKAQLLIEKARHMTSTQLEEKETVQAMVTNLERLTQAYETGEDSVVEKVQQAYANLENFMIDNEALWLKVCGMNVPQAGPDGAFAARSFRDGLELAKRNHPDIKASPEKAAIADKIIQLIFVVPDAGLTQEQVSKVTELAKELAIFDSTVAARLSLKNTADSSQKEVSATPAESSAASNHDPENTTTLPAQNRMEDATAENFAKEQRGDLLRSKTKAAFAGAKSSIESFAPGQKKKNGAMKVEVDTKDDGDIKITVAEKVEEELAEQDVSVVEAIEELTETTAGSEVVAHMERRDIINNSVPSKADRDLVKKESLKANALVSKYLLNEVQYANFFSEHTLTPEDFERQLQATIKSIDTKEIDFWEAKFDSPYTSAFSYLQDMSLAEVQEINKLAPQERRRVLTQENVKYEAYLAWMDILDPMTEALPVQPDMQFGDLFARWMMETEMTYYAGETNASQFTL